MAQYREGQKIKATTTIHRSTGSAWPGDTGKIVKVTGDGYHIRWDKGGWTGDVVKDSEVEPG
jgi:ribosomal protein L21E